MAAPTVRLTAEDIGAARVARRRREALAAAQDALSHGDEDTATQLVLTAGQLDAELVEQGRCPDCGRPAHQPAACETRRPR